MPEPQDTIARIHDSHKPGRSMTAQELFAAADLLDACADKSVPGFGSARHRVEAKLEELGY